MPPSIPSIPAAKTAQVQRFLHVNLNCADLTRSGEIYTSLFGLREIMHTESVDNDGLPMGITEPVDSRVSFLYDHRGARRSPSLELVAWDRPRVVQKRYVLPNHVGMQSVAYKVPSMEAVRAGVTGFGLSIGSLTSSDGLDAMLFMDPDGVTAEVYEDPTVDKATSRHIRLTVNDLARSQGWYEAIGFEVASPRSEQSWTWSIPGGEVMIARVATVKMVMPFDASYSMELTEWLSPRSQGTPNAFAADQGLYRMALGVENTAKAAAALQQAGWPWANDPARFVLVGTPLPDLWISFTKDPDGITVELVERPLESYK
jgi:catechol 2,3-dioxygenase-like lactoylglutathione lyase family enzyme